MKTSSDTAPRHITTCCVRFKAERVKTLYEETVLLSIRDPQNLSVRDLTPALLKVFLLKRYATVITDADISSINDELMHWNLISKGVCETTNTCVGN